MDLRFHSRRKGIKQIVLPNRMNQPGKGVYEEPRMVELKKRLLKEDRSNELKIDW